ncbi:hypothetical protein [Ruegeria hyattellae]|jgi:hypothetical protein|uniref:hypothetical protein n=1 Tax=Ruegeria hyattellae TaxID=3233337 RepID=UPI00355B0791
MATLNDHSSFSQPVRGGGTLLPFWIAGLIVAAFLSFDIGLSHGLKSVTSEGGPIETASALLWGYAALSLIWVAPGIALGRGWHFILLFLLFAARELDMDKAYLSEGILKARLYTGDAPLGEKLIGLMVIALILSVVIRMLRENLGDWLRALRQGSTWALAAGGALSLAIVSKTVDGAGRKLAPLGIDLSHTLDTGLGMAEEWMELGFVLLAILAVCLWARGRTEFGPTP